MASKPRQLGATILILFCGIFFLLGAVVGFYYIFLGVILLLIPSIIALLVSVGLFTLVVQSTVDRRFSIDSPQWDILIESLQMSENAKRVLFRDRELELFRTTVQADIARGEFHSALALCDQMATVFGAVEEAEQLRTSVQKTIHEHHEARITDELRKLQQLLNACKWVEAYQDAARLRRLFPDSPLLHGVEQHIADVRGAYRHELEERFLSAASREDVERAMVLLRELDGYLTPDEARRFRDTARTVIATFRETLGNRFKMAVSDHRWHEALEFGEEITRQFPNTKMAEEVHVVLETIQVRAEEDEQTS